MTNKLKCVINGRLCDEQAAVIPATDLTLRRGYGLFDFFRVHNSVPLYLPSHLERLQRGIDRLGLDVTTDVSGFEEQVMRLVRANEMDGVSGVRIVVTGGMSSDGFTPERSNVIITQERFKLPDEDLYHSGTALMTSEYRREIPDVKSLNYMHAVYLAPEMYRRGTTEILYYSDGRVSECTRSNLFCIRGNTLYTPASDVLAGITRKKILEIAEPALKVSVEDISLAFLMEADEVFISSTIKRIIPVVRIDDKAVANGMPGSQTRLLMEKLQRLDNEYLTNFNKQTT